MIKRTNHFSLIEVVIATSLFSILMFTTTSLFFRYHKLNATLENIRPKVLERTLFYEKVLDMSFSMEKESIKNSNPHYEHFLSFTFDNGFKDDASFSGRCNCKLYREAGNEIRYKIINEEKKERTRVLMGDVLSFNSHIKNNLLYLDIKLIDNSSLNYCFILPNKVSS